jgi:hypothetical protein
MKTSILVALVALFASGCASTVPPDVIASGDDSQTAYANPVRYRSPLAGYFARKPVDPKPWRQLNDDQTSTGGDAS